MSRFVQLEATHHRALRLDPLPHGGSAQIVKLGRSEIPLAVTDYPLFFAKDAQTGLFEVVALVGLTEPHNLFWRDGRWLATYVPEILIASPFRLAADSPTGLAIDRDDPRLGNGGEPLFDDAGEASPTLLRERERLHRIVSDVEEARRTAAALVAVDVVRAVTITISFDDGSSRTLDGLYSPDAERIAALHDPAVLALFRAGDLAVATLMNASFGQLERVRQLDQATSGRNITALVADFSDAGEQVTGYR